MLKILMITLLFATQLTCFSIETIKEEAIEHHDQGHFYLVRGNANLLLNEPLLALEDFQKAAMLLAKEGVFSNIHAFLISFGEIIAYDALNLPNECKQSMGSLFLAMNEYDDEEDLNSETIERQSAVFDHDVKEFTEFLRGLVGIAPSVEVRGLLLNVIIEIENEMSSTFEFANQPLLTISEWNYDNGTDQASVVQCKSIWKEVVKWTKRIAEFLRIARDAKNTLDDLLANGN